MDQKQRLKIVRKRAKALIKSGLTESEAYIKAWAEFRERNKSKQQITEPPSNISEQKLPDPVKNLGQNRTSRQISANPPN